MLYTYPNDFSTAYGAVQGEHKKLPSLRLLLILQQQCVQTFCMKRYTTL